MNSKRVLHHLGSCNPNDYILMPVEFNQLGFQTIPPITSSLLDNLPPLKLLSLDATYISTSKGEEISEITLIDEAETILFHETIKPEGEINEKYNLEETKMEKKLFSKQEAEKILTEIIQKEIIIGHNLAKLLNLMKIPFFFVIDTVMLYPHKEFFLSNRKRPLKVLTFENLHYEIQEKTVSSRENALAVMRLVKNFINKGKGKPFGEVLDPKEGVFTEINLSMIYKYLEFKETEICNVYLRGSRAVGTDGLRFDGTISDWDFVIVLDTTNKICDEHLSYGNIDAAVYDKKIFGTMVEENVIWTLECLFAHKNRIFKEQIEYSKYFLLNLGKLRNSVSCETARQIAKSKRNENNLYKVFKSLFIAMRYYFYGIEIAKFGTIKNFEGMNHVWKEMISKKDELKTWQQIFKYYEPQLKQLKKEFSDLCPYQNQYQAKDFSKTKTKPKFQKKHQKENEKSDSKEKEEIKIELENEDSELEVIKYLRKHDLAQLCEEYKIKFNRHQNQPNLIQLHYQVYSDFSKKISRECRGIILDESKNWELVALPFYKFFDHGDKFFINTIDWESAMVYEKIDGSMATLYYYNNKWNVASSSCPDGSAMMCFKNPEKKTIMEKLFWGIFEEKKYKLPENIEFCYIFEVITRNHVIVIEYEEDNLILLGARNMKTLKEEKAEVIGEINGWNYVKAIRKADNLEEVITEAKGLDSTKKEGFVICDRFFQRIKVKCPEYLRKNWMFPICPSKHQMNERHILYIIRSNEGENFVKYCPEWKVKYLEIRGKFDKLKDEIKDQYVSFMAIKDDKEFALAINKKKSFVAGALFALRKGCSLDEYLSTVNIKSLENRLEITVKPFKYNETN